MPSSTCVATCLRALCNRVDCYCPGLICRVWHGHGPSSPEVVSVALQSHTANIMRGWSCTLGSDKTEPSCCMVVCWHVQIFESIGPVRELVVLRDRATQESKGSAFVWYATGADADKVRLGPLASCVHAHHCANRSCFARVEHQWLLCLHANGCGLCGLPCCGTPCMRYICSMHGLSGSRRQERGSVGWAVLLLALAHGDDCSVSSGAVL